MQGRVQKYIEDKGFGFITGQDDKSRFFHISQVKDKDELAVGSFVDFTSVENEKGLAAEKITINRVKGSRFIDIGGYNIDKSNIKSFSSFVDKRQKKVGEESNVVNDLLYMFTDTSYQSPRSIMKKYEVRVLNIITYSGNDYSFDEDEVNINEALKALKAL